MVFITAHVYMKRSHGKTISNRYPTTTYRYFKTIIIIIYYCELLQNTRRLKRVDISASTSFKLYYILVLKVQFSALGWSYIRHFIIFDANQLKRQFLKFESYIIIIITTSNTKYR